MLIKQKHLNDISTIYIPKSLIKIANGPIHQEQAVRVGNIYHLVQHTQSITLVCIVFCCFKQYIFKNGDNIYYTHYQLQSIFLLFFILFVFFVYFYVFLCMNIGYFFILIVWCIKDSWTSHRFTIRKQQYSHNHTYSIVRQCTTFVEYIFCLYNAFVECKNPLKIQLLLIFLLIFRISTCMCLYKNPIVSQSISTNLQTSLHIQQLLDNLLL